mgnify:CR=1 FL=1
MRRAAKTDANHAEVVAAFRKLGWSVLDLSRVGQGCPDILCGRPGYSVLVEIKDGAKVPSQRKLTEDQIDFHAEWRGPLVVVKDVEDVRLLTVRYG